MTEQGGDGLEAHASVEALRCQCVPELVRVNSRNAGSFGDPFHVAVNGAPIERLAVFAFEQEPVSRRPPPRLVVGDQTDQQRVEGDVAVVVQLADRDA